MLRHDDPDLEIQTVDRPQLTYVETQPPERTYGDLGLPIRGAARLPIEFRTLSIHVETRRSLDSNGQPKDPLKAAAKELISLEWHKISVDEVLQRQGVSPVTGLETVQAQRRLNLSGANTLSKPRSNLGKKILEWCLGGFGSLLLIGSIICFIAWKPLGNPAPQASNLALAIVLLLVLVLQAAFNAWQDFSTSRVMSSIKDMLPSNVTVRRDGVITQIAAHDLVPGDIVTISMGDKIPADMRLIETGNDLLFDRSVLTGESEALPGRVEMTDVNFLETKNIALQGTHCVAGSGVGVVIQTGDRTVFGVIARLSNNPNTRLSTLQKEILRFVILIASLALSVALLIVILWAAWLRRSYPGYINVPTLLIDVVSVMVAFIPEGLPVAVTLSLAQVAHRLGKQKILCKTLSIIETLGSVNVLCSDKTGTLTQNIMHVQSVAISDAAYGAEEYKELVKSTSDSDKSNALLQCAAVAAICNAAVYEEGTAAAGSSPIAPAKRPILGNATDTAALRFSEDVLPAEGLLSQWKHVYHQSFNSKTKFMLQLSRLSNTDTDPGRVAPIASWDEFHSSSILLTMKGAPEVLLPRCSYVLDPSGSGPVRITPEILRSLAAVQETWAREGQRVLLLARKVVNGDAHAHKSSEELADFAEGESKDELIVVGLIGLTDPLKPDIKHTVSTCRKAGIRFFVVTGDHPTTAVSIAGQAGIITDPTDVHHVHNLDEETLEKEGTPGSEELTLDLPSVDKPSAIVLTGPELELLTESQIDRLCKYDEIVFARTTPEQKLRIVNDFQARGGIVAVTGDGVNDAPSLKAANCGIAMGMGSDVAREAADLILMGEFSSIIIGIEYGRLVFDNLKKSVLYLLPAGSFSELMPIIFNIVFGLPQMLSNIQMIIICVGTDVLPALSMCMEPPESGLLQRKPRNVKTDRLVDWKLLLHAYGFLGVLESLAAMSMSFWYLRRKGVPFSNLFLGFGTWPGLDTELLSKAQSVYFFTLVLMQWGNLFASRGRTLSIFKHHPGLNWRVVPAAVLALGIGLFFSYVPWFQKIFLTRGVSVEHYFLPIAFGLALLSLDELRKYLVKKFPRGVLAKLAW
ncbi:sodium-potassium ATPase [Ephemerocybe angulata]|uniref:Sodium-potassium ATPase n=1 Tax=Ephemerocybe angulata TaxID=980116 RepID=A0A8H6M927_9AGAR|nr:sodium-potassium ATPase [Tulosesus angulatus]